MKSTITRIFGLLSLITGFSSLTASGQVGSSTYDAMLRALLSHSVSEMSVPAVQGLKKEQVYFLDAREQREFDVSHIEGAYHVGYDHFNLSTVKSIPTDARLIVYCSVGYRSEKVAEKLQKAGFKNVSNLYGGIFEWVNQGHAVYDKRGPTTRVHAYDQVWGVWLKRGEKVY